MKARTKNNTFTSSCIHAQIQDVLPGGGGPGPTARKQPGQRFYFSSQLMLQFTEVLLQRKLYFSKDQERVQHFPGGGQLFPGGKCI